MKPYALLQELGFGEYEAKAYVALLSGGQSTGYEVAKAAAIPRPNVYAVLDRLVARGAAQRFDTAAGVRYAATPASRMLRRLEQKHQRTLAAAREGLATLVQADEAAPAFTLRSESELLERARAGIDAARQTLLLAIQPAQAAPLADALQRASDRDVRITTLCLSGCEQECGACHGDIYRLTPAMNDEARWLLLVVDRSEALVGNVEPSMIQGVATAQRPMIELTGAYIRQSLTLALLADELGARIEKLVSPRTRHALDRLYPGGDFLAHVRSLGKLASSQMRQVPGSRSKE
ncbi:MAG: hypothetical protein LT102_05280 [Burkholderiaceae bacterium]|nr:hypothetical protein [Burkholderiaceae bacterium]